MPDPQTIQQSLYVYNVSNIIILVNKGFVKNFIIFADKLTIIIIGIITNDSIVKILLLTNSTHRIILIEKQSETEAAFPLPQSSNILASFPPKQSTLNEGALFVSFLFYFYFCVVFCELL